MSIFVHFGEIQLYLAHHQLARWTQQLSLLTVHTEVCVESRSKLSFCPLCVLLKCTAQDKSSPGNVEYVFRCDKSQLKWAHAWFDPDKICIMRRLIKRRRPHKSSKRFFIRYFLFFFWINKYNRHKKKTAVCSLDKEKKNETNGSRFKITGNQIRRQHVGRL